MTGLLITAAVAGLAVGALRPPQSRARLFEGLAWVAVGLLSSLVFR